MSRAEANSLADGLRSSTRVMTVDQYIERRKRDGKPLDAWKVRVMRSGGVECGPAK